MDEAKPKGSKSWIAYLVLAIGFGVFVVVFMKLQGGHDADVERCVAACKHSKLADCIYENGQSGSPCEDACTLTHSRTMECANSSTTCETFSSCVLVNQ